MEAPSTAPTPEQIQNLGIAHSRFTCHDTLALSTGITTQVHLSRLKSKCCFSNPAIQVAAVALVVHGLHSQILPAQKNNRFVCSLMFLSATISFLSNSNRCQNGFRHVFRLVSDTVAEWFQNGFRHGFRIVSDTVSDWLQAGLRLVPD